MNLCFSSSSIFDQSASRGVGVTKALFPFLPRLERLARNGELRILYPQDVAVAFTIHYQRS